VTLSPESITVKKIAKSIANGREEKVEEFSIVVREKVVEDLISILREGK